MRFLLVGILFLFLNSCIPHKSFVTSSFEPIVVEKRNDFQASISFRPMKYLDINSTYALTDNFAIRTDFGGFVGIYNLSGSLIYFNNYENLRYYIAPTYNYQNNQIKRNIPIIFGNHGKFYNYFCIYNGLGTSLGFCKEFDDFNFHFNLKVQYNFVKNYYYENYEDNGSSKSTGYEVLDREIFDKKISNFVNVEPSASFLFYKSDKRDLKVQVGINICEVKYINNYSYNLSNSSSIVKTNKNLHPSYLPIYVSLGYTFKVKRRYF